MSSSSGLSEGGSAERIAELEGLLERALEELRLIRMKDCGAVYDTMIRFEARAAIAKAEGRS